MSDLAAWGAVSNRISPGLVVAAGWPDRRSSVRFCVTSTSTSSLAHVDPLRLGVPTARYCRHPTIFRLAVNGRTAAEDVVLGLVEWAERHCRARLVGIQEFILKC